MHYAYTSNVHRELTTQMLEKARLTKTVWVNEGEEMSNVMILNSGTLTPYLIHILRGAY